MAHDLPSLNGLRAFEAAARHLSFKEAARELFVTPGAISQHIKGLEEGLGKPLFVRMSRSIALTEAGRTLLPVLGQAFGRIAEATARVMESDTRGPLNVSVLPSFAVKWLVPRLGGFRELHPEFDLRISVSNHPVDFGLEEMDVAIRHGLGQWPGLRGDWLMQGELFPVCAQALMEGEHPLRSPDDLRHHTLLHNDNRREWPLWLSVYQVKGVDAERGPSFSNMGLVLQAATAGQGVALGRGVFVEDDLRAGRLIKPFDLAIPSELAYYLVCPEATANQPKIVAFREWLIAEAKHSEGR